MSNTIKQVACTLRGEHDWKYYDHDKALFQSYRIVILLNCDCGAEDYEIFTQEQIEDNQCPYMTIEELQNKENTKV